MNPKQERFAREYLIDLNATQAAIRAGYSRKAATAVASRLLTYANVQEFIAQQKERAARKLEVTSDRVKGELALIAFSNMEDFTRRSPSGAIYLDTSKIGRDQMAAVSEMRIDEVASPRRQRGKNGKRVTITRKTRRVRLKLYDKRQALVDLGKHLGMFVDQPAQVVIDPAAQAEHSRALTLAMALLEERARQGLPPLFYKPPPQPAQIEQAKPPIPTNGSTKPNGHGGNGSGGQR